MKNIAIDEFDFYPHAAGVTIKNNQTEVLSLCGDFIFGISSKMNPTTKNGTTVLNRTVLSAVTNKAQTKLLQKDNVVELTGLLQDETPFIITFWVADGNLNFKANLEGFEEIKLAFSSSAEERFYGFGEQYRFLDMSQKAFTLCVSEQGIGRGAQPITTLVNLRSKGSGGDDFTTYAPMPVFVTSKNRAAAFNEHTIYHFDIRKSIKDKVSVSAHTNLLFGIFFCAKTPLQLIEKHTQLTGRLAPLPDFAYGTILGVRGGKQAAEEIIARCIEAGTPISALWIEDWQGRRGKNGGPPLWWRWYPDETLYPDFKNWASELSQRGIALLGYANPFLSADQTNPLYCEAVQNGYLVKNQDGFDYISSFFTGPEYTFACVDLTNPQAFDWLKQRMKEGMVENGLSGWMADYGEYIPLTSKVHSENAVAAHCSLPYLWAKLNSELIDETDNRGKLLVFHRSAGAFSNRFATAYWAGDQNPTLDIYDGLASSITALVTSGISGMSINHTDIGGFTTIMTPIYKLTRKKEVMFRWLEYAAFTPVFRTHDGNYSNKLNYQFYYDDEGYAFFAKTARLHNALKWYFKQLEAQAVQKGYPVVRALWLHYPTDEICQTIQYQFLLGSDILVSPVYKMGATQVKAYLPKDEWICPYTGKEFKGGTYEMLPAPIGKPAVLVRKNAPYAKELLESISFNL